MTEPFLVKKLNLHTCTKDDLEFNTHFNLKATRNGNLTALVAFFNVSFDDGHKGIVLSNPLGSPNPLETDNISPEKQCQGL